MHDEESPLRARGGLVLDHPGRRSRPDGGSDQRQLRRLPMLTWPQCRPNWGETASGPMVRVAVCICTCDRLASLAQVLAMLEGIELGDMMPDDVGVIVVDNRPDGRVRALCEQV